MSKRFEGLTAYEITILYLSLGERMSVLNGFGGEEYQSEQRAAIRALTAELVETARERKALETGGNNDNA